MAKPYRFLLLSFYSLLILFNLSFYAAELLLGNFAHIGLRACVLVGSISLGFVPIFSFSLFVSVHRKTPTNPHVYLMIGSVIPFLLSLSFNDLVRGSFNTTLHIIEKPESSIESPKSWPSIMAVLLCTLICATGEEVAKLVSVVLFSRPVYVPELPGDCSGPSFLRFPASTASDFLRIGVFTGLGFSVSENFWYFAAEMRSQPFDMGRAILVGVTRSLGSMHALLTGYSAASFALRREQVFASPDKSSASSLSVFIRSLFLPSLFHFALNVTALLLEKISSNIIAIRGLQAAIWIGFAMIFSGIYRRAEGVFM